MDPEVWIGIAAVFVSGGAVGTAGTLMAVWLARKIIDEPQPRRPLSTGDMALLRGDVSEMDRRLRNIDARLEFQEQLLAGGSPTRVPPPRLAEPPPIQEDPAESPHRDEAGHDDGRDEGSNAEGAGTIEADRRT